MRSVPHTILLNLPRNLHVPLSQLLHVCLMNADSLNPIVRRDSQQLLVYLLYSLSLKHLEAAQVTCSGNMQRWLPGCIGAVFAGPNAPDAAQQGGLVR